MKRHLILLHLLHKELCTYTLNSMTTFAVTCCTSVTEKVMRLSCIASLRRPNHPATACSHVAPWETGTLSSVPPAEPEPARIEVPVGIMKQAVSSSILGHIKSFATSQRLHEHQEHTKGPGVVPMRTLAAAWLPWRC